MGHQNAALLNMNIPNHLYQQCIVLRWSLSYVSSSQGMG